jgi:hypothetical protein
VLCRQGISQRPSHIDGAGGVDCRPAGGLADGEEAAYALDSMRCTNVAPLALCADQRRTGQIHRVVAYRFIAGAGRGGVNPQLLSSPDLRGLQSSLGALIVFSFDTLRRISGSVKREPIKRAFIFGSTHPNVDAISATLPIDRILGGSPNAVQRPRHL